MHGRIDSLLLVVLLDLFKASLVELASFSLHLIKLALVRQEMLSKFALRVDDNWLADQEL